jgi:minor histocompatibility antigen H13
MRLMSRYRTIVVMHTFRAAQPALLYLSPACILSVLATAAVRGEVSQLWSFADGEEDEGEEKKKSDKPAEAANEIRKDQ